MKSLSFGELGLLVTETFFSELLGGFGCLKLCEIELSSLLHLCECLG